VTSPYEETWVNVTRTRLEELEQREAAYQALADLVAGGEVDQYRFVYDPVYHAACYRIRAGEGDGR
jgi:hypothetical protein